VADKKSHPAHGSGADDDQRKNEKRITKRKKDGNPPPRPKLEKKKKTLGENESLPGKKTLKRPHLLDRSAAHVGKASGKKQQESLILGKKKKDYQKYRG